MKILVIGSGGREHALVWKIAQSPIVSKIYCAPGNPGTAGLAENVSLKLDQFDKLVQLVRKEKIDLTIVGPEIPLIGGIVDLFEKHNLKIIGPSKKASQIEGSKVFSKKLMLKYKIPTAEFVCFDDYKYPKLYLKRAKFPLVIKADGQCAGKGVMVCKNEKEAQQFLKQIMKDKIFGNSGNKIVIEECLFGQEVSFMVVTDGTDFVSLLPSQDHKRVNDGDTGSNTGGMGAYAPVPFISKKMVKKIEAEIVGPVISAMKKEGYPYKGILYPGIILTNEGPKVLEFNCRFGDPETQPLMMMLKSDIIDILEAVLRNKVKNLKIRWHKGAAVCVVLTSKGYPGEYKKGDIIYGLPAPKIGAPLSQIRGAPSNPVAIFHSGTKKSENHLVSNSGRVLGVTARDKSLMEAIKKVYELIGSKRIHFSGMHYRKDIGKKGLNKKLWE